MPVLSCVQRRPERQAVYIKEETLDDLLHRVISKLLQSKSSVQPSRGKNAELAGVLLQLTNPRARISRTEKKGHIFSCLGELFWYLAGADDLDFITYYVERYAENSDDGRTIFGAYGPRLFKMHGQHDQLKNVIDLLRRKPTSRRAVIQLFDAEDIAEDRVEVPCTCTLQFLVRDNRVLMFTNMRSNDAFFGLPHDIFAFTMIQEIVARSLGFEVGTYKHAVGSLHLYDNQRTNAQQFVDEGIQARIPMPAMPTGDPWRAIARVVDAEEAVRNGQEVDARKLGVGRYWEDLVRLLQVYKYYRNRTTNRIPAIKKQMSTKVFDAYIDQKKKPSKKRVDHVRMGQLPLFSSPAVD
jgi:thymidylate synthase